MGSLETEIRILICIQSYKLVELNEAPVTVSGKGTLPALVIPGAMTLSTLLSLAGWAWPLFGWEAAKKIRCCRKGCCDFPQSQFWTCVPADPEQFCPFKILWQSGWRILAMVCPGQVLLQRFLCRLTTPITSLNFFPSLPKYQQCRSGRISISVIPLLTQ